MVSFTDTILRLEAMGLTDVLLPFILVFTIVFAVMQKTPVFKGEDTTDSAKKKYDAVVALCMALGVVIPHVTNPGSRYDVVQIINTALPNVSLVLIGIICTLILLGTLGFTIPYNSNSPAGLVTWGIGGAVILYIFGRAAGWFRFGLPRWLSWLDDPDTQALIVILIVFWLILRYIMKEDEGEDARRARREASFNRFWSDF